LKKNHNPCLARQNPGILSLTKQASFISFSSAYLFNIIELVSVHK